MFFTRRIILKLALMAGAIAAFAPLRTRRRAMGAEEAMAAPTTASPASDLLGVDEDGFSQVYLARNGSPAENVARIVDMMGGIEKIIAPTDIVLLKPNAQWWNQGTTNTDAMQAFIDMVLAIRGFSGEVIIADNHQYHGDDSRGWNTDKRNGRFNLNELVEHYRQNGHANVTKYHWRVGGTTSVPLEGDAQGDRRVRGPEDGDGYVWLEDIYYLSPNGRKCIMTYPVFTSSYSGITIDLKRGPWQDGSWLADRRLKFINFSALNYHGWYCGVTASVKNLMGVVDMSCGFPGDRPAGTFNTHHIGVSRLKEMNRRRLVWRIAKTGRFRRFIYRNFHHTGGALGYFMKHVRFPDLNIITAESVGWGSRTTREKAFQARAVLAGRDPVALDYMAAREILLPGTPAGRTNEFGDEYRKMNDPDVTDGPFSKFLQAAQQQGIGVLTREKIRLVTAPHPETRGGMIA